VRADEYDGQSKTGQPGKEKEAGGIGCQGWYGHSQEELAELVNVQTETCTTWYGCVEGI